MTENNSSYDKAMSEREADCVFQELVIDDQSVLSMQEKRVDDIEKTGKYDKTNITNLLMAIILEF